MNAAAEQENRDAILRNVDNFAELVGTLHALHFTGPITLHFLNGQPQMAEMGRPQRVSFLEHPANRRGSAGPCGQKTP